MVDAISGVNSLNSKRCEKPQLAFKGEQAPVDMEQKPDTFEKENEVAQTTEEKQGMTRGKKNSHWCWSFNRTCCRRVRN